MQTFLVERDFGTTAMADLFGLLAANQRHALLMRDDGDRIYYLGSTYIPEDGRCLCLFEAKNQDVVAQHSKAARLPVIRIFPAISMSMPPNAAD